MKKLLLAAVLFISLATSAQTFTRHYDLVVTKSNSSNRVNEVEPTNVTAIFSCNYKGDIIILNSTATDLIA